MPAEPRVIVFDPSADAPGRLVAARLRRIRSAIVLATTAALAALVGSLLATHPSATDAWRTTALGVFLLVPAAALGWLRLLRGARTWFAPESGWEGPLINAHGLPLAFVGFIGLAFLVAASDNATKLMPFIACMPLGFGLATLWLGARGGLWGPIETLLRDRAEEEVASITEPTGDATSALSCNGGDVRAVGPASLPAAATVRAAAGTEARPTHAPASASHCTTALSIAAAGLPARVIDEDLHCLRCNHNLRGLSGPLPRCPECGHVNPVGDPVGGVALVPASYVRDQLLIMETPLGLAAAIPGLMAAFITAARAQLVLAPELGLLLVGLGVLLWLTRLARARTQCRHDRRWVRVAAVYHLFGVLAGIGAGCLLHHMALLGTTTVQRLYGSAALGVARALAPEALALAAVAVALSLLQPVRRIHHEILRPAAERAARDEFLKRLRRGDPWTAFKRLAFRQAG